MRMWCKMAAVVFVLFSPLGAVAENVAVDGIIAELPLPKGYCALSKDHPADLRYIQRQERLQAGINRVVILAIPCGALPKIRRGEDQIGAAVWLLNLENGRANRVPAGYARSEFVKTVASIFPRIKKESASRYVEDSAKQEDLAVKTEGPVLIGVDELAYYGALTALAGRVGGPRYAVAGVFGGTMIHGRMFTFNFYGEAEKGTSLRQARTDPVFQRLQTEVRQIIQETTKKNPEFAR